MLYEAVLEIIGEVPPGYEGLVYVCSLIILVWLLLQVSSILWSICGWLSGK